MQKLIATCSVALLLLIAGLAVFHSMAWSAISTSGAPLSGPMGEKPANDQGTIVLQAGPMGSIAADGGQHTVLLAGSASGNIWHLHRAVQ